MKTPPLLVGAALLFWGWQTGFIIEGAVMAVVLEGARFVKARWELSNDDFNRIWTFCAVLFLATAAYGFTANKGPANVSGLFTVGGFSAQNNVGTTASKTAVLVIRGLPMVFFLFVAAQVFSDREVIPLEAISLILRRRLKRAQKSGQPLPPTRTVNVTYPYFIACLVAASGHPAAENNGFYWGLCGLIAWALWMHRSRRFSGMAWAVTMALAILLGYGGQQGLVRLKGLIDQYNPQWFSGLAHGNFDPLEAHTEIGQIGRIKTSGQIVIRLETTNGVAPQYLREAAYRTYRAAFWNGGGRTNDFSSVLENPPSSEEWPLLADKPKADVVNIACYLPGGKSVLPLPTDSDRLDELPAYVLQKNGVGTVRAEGPGLVIFNARYGPGDEIDFPPDTNDDLAVPETEKPALDEVVAGLQISGTNRESKIDAVSRFFASKFTYRLWQDQPAAKDTNYTAVGRFLLRTRSGHCEYFATATVLLLRDLGIPARYTVGFAVHEQSGKKFVVRQSDAHAWCRVWNDRTKLWEDFDTTPGVWLDVERQHLSSFQFIYDGWSRAMFEFSKFRWGQSNLRQYIVWALVPVLALLLYQIIFRSGKRRAGRQAKTNAGGAIWPGLDSEFYELERKLAQQGLIRQSSETLSDWLRRTATDPKFSKLGETWRRLLLLHYRYRFDPAGLSVDDREILRREVRACVSNLELKR